MRIYIILLMILMLSFISHGQTSPYGASKPCELTIKDSPVLHGFKLGMSRHDFLKVFPIVKTDETKDYLVLEKTNFPKQRVFENAKTISISFFENKILIIDVKYDESVPDWTPPKNLADLFTNILNLPANVWLDEKPLVLLACKELTINIDSMNRQITMVDTVALDARYETEQKGDGFRKKKLNP